MSPGASSPIPRIGASNSASNFSALTAGCRLRIESSARCLQCSKAIYTKHRVYIPQLAELLARLLVLIGRRTKSNLPQMTASLDTLSPFACEPLVTAVIPTRNRPELVTRAVRSALAQTYPRMEVVVVIDGPDAVTSSALELIHDERLRVISLPQPVGGAEARNVGVQAAQGEWIGL